MSGQYPTRSPASYEKTPASLQEQLANSQRGNKRPASRPGSADNSRELSSSNSHRSAQTNLTQSRTLSTTGSDARYHPPPNAPSSNRSGSDYEMEDEEFPHTGGVPQRSSVTQQTSYETYEPPPGPPPSRKRPNAETATSDPWQKGRGEVQRQSPLLFSTIVPPQPTRTTGNPPVLSENAKEAQAWCREHPLWKPAEREARVLQRMQAGDLALTVPPNTTDVTVYHTDIGRTYIRTSSAVGDTIFLSDIPIYTSWHDSPLVTGRSRTLYFELYIKQLGDRYQSTKIIPSGIAIGFVAPPYPAWRLPGLHRGSLGVYGNDGRRYIADSYRGIEFTAPFKAGEVVGIGMVFAPPVSGSHSFLRSQVFFVRNGTVEGAWDLHQDRNFDVAEGDIAGLEGEHDLLAAVGSFGAVEFEVSFRREEWLYKPPL